jgi:hypothetical protein
LVLQIEANQGESLDELPLPPKPSQRDANLTPNDSGHMVLNKDRVEMGKSHYFKVQHQDS